MVVSSVYVSGIGLGVLGLVIPAVHSLQKQRWMSQSTYQFQKKWLRNLYIQIASVMACVFIPFFWYFYIGYDERFWLTEYSIYPTSIACFHGTVATIVLLICYDSYQGYLFKSIFFIQKNAVNDSTLNPKSTTTVQISIETRTKQDRILPLSGNRNGR
ncbi:unnamed protein product, partial [Mesorhabditis belari]|uniref:Uncharacterized protein n=1 Tax=Mesorhabditis belari TaxID=2138241 RepID=A0AAF3F9D2_9BILA